MPDDSRLSRDCQSISDGQGYSDRGTIQYAWLTIRGCPAWLSGDCQSISDQGYSSKIVRVTMELSDEP